MQVPLWAVALVVAAAAPFVVRLVADTIAERVRRRTERAIMPQPRGRNGRDSLSSD